MNKKVIAGALTLGVGVALGWWWKGDEVVRLSNVNTLFDEAKIVENFSNMDGLFLTRDMEVGTLPAFPEAMAPLPEQVGIGGEARDLTTFLKETDTTSLLVLKDGTIVFEEYYQGTGQDDQRISWSVAKSFLSALVGRAIGDGSLPGVDVQVVDYVPELKGTAYEGATLRNVLNMASGVRFNEDYFDPDSDINRMGRELALGGSLDAFSEELVERAFEPGTSNQYVSIDTHVIGRVLRAATGRSVYDLFEEAYRPIGLGPVTYMTDGEGEAFVLGGLLMTTRGYGAFGQLFLQDGQWEGEQIIPADWVAESTAISAPPVYGGPAANGGRAYGYQWWMLPDQIESGYGDYFANGIYGQTVYVNPALDVVVVKTSADRQFRETGPSGTGWQVETIEMMRGLAEHYASQA